MKFQNYWKIPKDAQISLVNERDSKIGVTNLTQALKKGIANIRFIEIFFEHQGRIWIPKVAENSDLFLDLSATCPVLSGEDYQSAFKKFLKEVLVFENFEYFYIGNFTPFDGSKTDVFLAGYKILFKKPFGKKLSVILPEGKWFTPQEIFDQIFRGEKATNDLKNLLVLVYEDQLKKIHTSDLLDFDPEDDISDYISNVVKKANSNIYIEDLRVEAEKFVNEKIAAVVKDKIKIFPKGDNIFLKGEKGYVPYSHWPLEPQQSWCVGMAQKYGIKYKRYLRKYVFTCKYYKKSGGDYKAWGESFDKIELLDSAETKVLKVYNCGKEIDGITIREKIEDHENYTNEISEIYIHDESVLPLRIWYNYKDIYSSSYGGYTMGGEECLVKSIRINTKGQIVTETTEGKKAKKLTIDEVFDILMEPGPVITKEECDILLDVVDDKDKKGKK